MYGLQLSALCFHCDLVACSINLCIYWIRLAKAFSNLYSNHMLMGCEKLYFYWYLEAICPLLVFLDWLFEQFRLWRVEKKTLYFCWYLFEMDTHKACACFALSKKCGDFSMVRKFDWHLILLQPPPGNSWLGSLIATIIGNLKISISNVHIRYEDSVRLAENFIIDFFYLYLYTIPHTNLVSHVTIPWISSCFLLFCCPLRVPLVYLSY